MKKRHVFLIILSFLLLTYGSSLLINSFRQNPSTSDIYIAKLTHALGQGNPEELTIALARIAAAQPDWYKGGADRINNLSSMISPYFRGILDSMTAYERDSANISSKPGWMRYHVNVSQLRALLELILFNQHLNHPEKVCIQLLDYAKHLQDQINNANDVHKTGFYDAAVRLAMLSAAIDDEGAPSHETSREKPLALFSCFPDSSGGKDALFRSSENRRLLKNSLTLGIENEERLKSVKDTADRIAKELRN